VKRPYTKPTVTKITVQTSRAQLNLSQSAECSQHNHDSHRCSVGESNKGYFKIQDEKGKLHYHIFKWGDAAMWFKNALQKSNPKKKYTVISIEKKQLEFLKGKRRVVYLDDVHYFNTDTIYDLVKEEALKKLTGPEQKALGMK